jgi:hypothetical protein
MVNSALLAGVDFDGISRSTAWDVHPPLFYWLLRRRAPRRRRGSAYGGVPLVNLPCFAFAAVFSCWRCGARRGMGVFPSWPRVICFLSGGDIRHVVHPDVRASFVRVRRFFLLRRVCRNPGARWAFRRVRWGAGLPSPRSRLLGALSHYYFLLFALPVCAACAVILARRGDAHALLWGARSPSSSDYTRPIAFSPRWKRISFILIARRREWAPCFAGGAGRRLGSVWAFALIGVRYMPAVAASLAVVGALAVPPLRARLRAMDAEAGATRPSACVRRPSRCRIRVHLLAVSLTAPYRSLRYLVAFACLRHVRRVRGRAPSSRVVEPISR